MTPEPLQFPNQPQFHLAQINIALMKAPLDDPIMDEFATALDTINAIADQSPGFVWRLQTPEGNATSIQAFPDPHILANISVWQTVEQLKAYVYKSLHGDFFSRRRQWFKQYQGEHFAMWWIPVGHQPSIEEGKAKLEHLTIYGNSPEAFTFASPYPAPIQAFRTIS